MKGPATLISVIWAILTVIILLIVIILATFQLNQVVGKSMEPTISDGKTCFSTKLFLDVKRDQAIMYLDKQDRMILGRVIGMPGDVIKNDNNTLNFASIVHPVATAPTQESTIPLNQSITLGSEEYFILGDNEGASLDSRYSSVGVIKKDKLVSMVLLCI
jgi:signal peptidase I